MKGDFNLSVPWIHCAKRYARSATKEQAARIAVSSTRPNLTKAQASSYALVEQGIKDGGVRLAGLSNEIDRLQREIQLLGAVNSAALDELTPLQGEEDLFGCTNGRFDRGDVDTGGGNQED
jgi:hypothetical protein